MANNIEISNNNFQKTPLIPCENKNDLLNMTQNILFDVKSDISQVQKFSMPISQLSALGANVASLLPAFRTVTQIPSIDGEVFYKWVNAEKGSELKALKDGLNWGAYKTQTGESKMAKFQKVGSISSTNTIELPINPTTMMMAVALFSIEKQLGNIAETQKNILSFLEAEKESEIEADVETLSNIIEKYKYNWDNKQFVSSNHKLVIDIQRTARKNMNSYQKKVKDSICEKKFLVSQSKIKSVLDELIKSFKYYRLSLFAFSMSSLIEIMLSENFNEENILAIKKNIQNLALSYRETYSECSLYLENLGKSSVESNLLKGVGTTSKAVGKIIGSIPKIKDGQIDERLQGVGEHIKNKAKEIESDSIMAFAEISNPGVNIFTEKMNDLILIFNHTNEICFDNNNIFIISD